jgi:hypothetical protein
MGLYERLLAEAAQEVEENPEWEEQRRRQAIKRQRMQAYVNSRRRAVLDEGGYVTSEEIKEEQDRHLTNLQALGGLEKRSSVTLLISVRQMSNRATLVASQ